MSKVAIFYFSIIAVLSSCKKESVTNEGSPIQASDTIWQANSEKKIGILLKKAQGAYSIVSVLKSSNSGIQSTDLPSNLFENTDSTNLASVQSIREHLVEFSDYDFDRNRDIQFTTQCTASQCICRYFFSGSNSISEEIPCVSKKTADGKGWILDSKDGVNRDSLEIRFKAEGFDTLSRVHFEPISDSEMSRTILVQNGRKSLKGLVDTFTIR